jgi:hypothetical protein
MTRVDVGYCLHRLIESDPEVSEVSLARRA